MVVRNGTQIVRKYQPVVHNPNTVKQVAARARLKLMSQLASVMAPVLAIPRQGTVSQRNRFVSLNYGASSVNDGIAEINLVDVKLTKSVVSFPGLVVSRSEGNITVQTSAGMGGLSRVIYALFTKEEDNTLRLRETAVVSEPGVGLVWAYTTTARNVPYVVYGYGIRDNTETARTTFGNMQVIQAEEVAKLIATRVLTEDDVTVTETKAAESPTN